MGKIIIEYEDLECSKVTVGSELEKDIPARNLEEYKDRFVSILFTLATNSPFYPEIIGYSQRLTALSEECSQKVPNGYKIVLNNSNYLIFNGILSDAKNHKNPAIRSQFDSIFGKISHYFKYPNENDREKDSEF
jgi:hypothetical protein